MQINITLNRLFVVAIVGIVLLLFIYRPFSKPNKCNQQLDVIEPVIDLDDRIKEFNLLQTRLIEEIGTTM